MCQTYSLGAGDRPQPCATADVPVPWLQAAPGSSMESVVLGITFDSDLFVTRKYGCLMPSGLKMRGLRYNKFSTNSSSILASALLSGRCPTTLSHGGVSVLLPESRAAVGDDGCAQGGMGLVCDSSQTHEPLCPRPADSELGEEGTGFHEPHRGFSGTESFEDHGWICG